MVLAQSFINLLGDAVLEEVCIAVDHGLDGIVEHNGRAVKIPRVFISDPFCGPDGTYKVGKPVLPGVAVDGPTRGRKRLAAIRCNRIPPHRTGKALGLLGARQNSLPVVIQGLNKHLRGFAIPTHGKRHRRWPVGHLRGCIGKKHIAIPMLERKFPHSIGFSGGACDRSSKASRGEDLEVEEPVSCRDFASFDFHTTSAGVLGATLVGDKVVQVCQSCKKRLLAPMGMMECFHHKEFPVDGVMRLIE